MAVVGGGCEGVVVRVAGAGAVVVDIAIVVVVGGGEF